MAHLPVRACNTFFVRKYDASGGIVWTDTVDGSAGSSDCGVVYGIAIGSDNSVYVTGGTVNADIWIRKYAPDGASDDGLPEFIGP